MLSFRDAFGVQFAYRIYFSEIWSISHLWAIIIWFIAKMKAKR